MLEIASMNSRPRLSSVRAYGIGRGLQMSMASRRARRGARVSRRGDACDGRTGSLVNNFTPSAMG